MVEATHTKLYGHYLEMALGCYDCFAPTAKKVQLFFCEMTPINQIFKKDLMLIARDDFL
jgi:hypothetical protein